MRGAQLSPNDRRDRGFGASAINRIASRRRLQDGRRVRSCRLQVQPVARLGADAAPARQRFVRAVNQYSMPTLFCFGLGYSASHYIAEFGRRFHRIAGTVTTREKATAIAAAGIGRYTIEAFVFDGSEAPAQIAAALIDATALLISAPP